MRAIPFLWFFKICWDDSRSWTLLFSLFVPLVTFATAMEVFRFIVIRKYEQFCLLCCCFLALFLNEFILRPSMNADPLSDSCDPSISGPSTSIALAAGAFGLYAIRSIASRRFSIGLAIWGCVLALNFVARPLLYYLTWGTAGISLVPGFVSSLVLYFSDSSVVLKYLFGAFEIKAPEKQ